MRLHRLIAILLLIESRGMIKAKELAVALETSVRTIHRDIDTLCEAGIPIAASTGPNGGIYIIEGYSLKMNNLHSDDVVNLYLSGIGIHPDGQSETGIRLKNALLKLEKSLPEQYIPDIRIARERFYFDQTPWWGELPKVPYLDILRRSVWQSKKLRMIYAKVNGEISERIVCPYGLVVKSMQWYLIASSDSNDRINTFKCERITSAEIKEERFLIPEKFSLEKYWKESTKEFKSSRRETERYPVVLRLRKQNASALRRLEVFELKEEDNYILATVNMHKFDFACNEVLEIIGQAEVIAPIEMRNFAADKLRAVLKLYDSDSKSFCMKT